jgi:hypothetical protein
MQSTGNYMVKIDVGDLKITTDFPCCEVTTAGVVTIVGKGN